MREPAYCDRILYKSINQDFIRPKIYEAAHELMTSDHSPVYGVFEVDVPLHSFPHQRMKCEIKINYLKARDLKISKTLPNPYIIIQVFDK